uniref:Advanced glycosylation end-product specific receptor n=1 Tax=Pipistrellus kuhlii TaxID=59472 RepID=A0A7J7YKM6_PIPKU|nr:advanced glycosylation end-product specific receptor [Pipistrellus kuhlii]
MVAGAVAGAWVLALSLWGAGAVAGCQNVTAAIGKPLVLRCKGAPRKPPQQLEWRLHTGRTEAWKVLSPQGGSWDSVARVLPNGSLLLPAVGVPDEGTFRCRALGILGGLGAAALLIGVIVWQRRRRRGEERKAPDNQEEEEEERAELNQSQEPDAVEGSAGGP